MAEYTPTMAEVRGGYVVARYPSPDVRRHGAAAEFDRWLASVKAEAWDEAVNAVTEPTMDSERARMTLRAVVPLPLNPYRDA